MITREREKEFEMLVADNKAVITKVCYMYATDSDHFKDLWQENRITINTCITCFRKGKKYLDNVSLDNDSMMQLADRATDDHEHAACLHEMYRLINRLPALDKALVLMWLDEKSYHEIAEVTGLSRGNVAARLSRCKQKLTRMSDE